MLTMPEGGSSIVRIVGLDPGTETLGVAVLDVDLASWKIVSSSAQTYRGSKLAKKSFWIEQVHGARTNRILAHEANLFELFCQLQPFEVACESPYSDRKFPQSFGALVEILSSIRRAAMRYDAWRPVYLIDPATVKNAVGVKGNKGGPEGKALMQKAVLTMCAELNYSGQVPLEQLDEHSIDALAVAYCRYKSLKQELLP